MEVEDNAKREQLLHSMQNLSVASQIEKLKVESSADAISSVSVSVWHSNIPITHRLELI